MRAIQLLLVVVGAIAVAALAHKKGLQSSLVVVVLAALVSFVPGLPRFELPPEMILGVVLPPLLYSAALDFSFVSLTRNLRPILGLGVGLVVASTLVTGVVAWWVVPGLALVPALVLGSVVAPPDAVAALAVGRRLGLPKRLMAILTGESLLNDAAALTIFTLTVAAATGGHTVFENPLLLFGYGVLVGSLIGLALGFVVHWIRQRLRDSGLETALGLVVPFAAYLFAEELHASGVLAVVAAGLTLGHNDTSAGFATRLQGREVWKSLDVLLEAFVFAYMGLQCRFVFADLHLTGTDWLWFALPALALLATVILVRPLWVLLTYGQNKLFRRERLPWPYVLVISWTGMRGVVTMAAAAGVPPMPGRDLIQALAFVIAVGTLLIQGPSLPVLIRRLALSDPAEEREDLANAERAQQISRRAAKKTLTKLVKHPPANADPELMRRFEEQITAKLTARRAAAEVSTPALREIMLQLRRDVLAAQRLALATARDEGKLDEDTVRRELERLDYEEAAAAAVS
ncbi:cation:proton antiporter [Kutzneria albida]|uniref:Cation/H+ exchanger transmembrane domain-containing protein n=1 Tax=Kutzneria albida DSM 43870 TaxID=1449976 RepID=W5WFF9_9PSEU|nr:sodium:proton antiporter [Kutzneria albida]AHH99485.1 hypothetical protein KALB_6125 [Kutzneria albida DSM 43870]